MTWKPTDILGRGVSYYRQIHWRAANSPHTGRVTRKNSFVIMSHAMYYPRHQSAMNRFMNIFSSSRRVHNVKVINSSCWLLLPCCWLRYADANINKSVLLRGTVHRHRAGRPSDSPAATDSPRDAWWTVSCSYTFWFLSRDVKNTKYNQYFPVFWRRLMCPTQDFGNSYCFEHDVIMSGHCDITVVGLDTIVCS